MFEATTTLCRKLKSSRMRVSVLQVQLEAAVGSIQSLFLRGIPGTVCHEFCVLAMLTSPFQFTLII